MQPIRYALRFIREVYALAINHAKLQKTWLPLWVGSLVIVLMGMLPLILVISLVGLQPIGLVLIGLIVVLIYFSLVVWAEASMVRTVRVFESLIQEQKESATPEDQPASVNRRVEDAALLAVGSPGMGAIQLVRKIFKPNDRVKGSKWLEHHHLTLPIIALEDLSLQEAFSRLKQMVEEKYVKVRPEIIRVNLIARIVQWGLLFCGILVGFTVGVNVADPITAKTLIQILGMGIGLLISSIFAIAGNHFSGFTRICYHTALYVWARNLEHTAGAGTAEKAMPPMILTRALGRSTRPEGQ